jgi:2-(1,2-epoxy-1,2-dihydrophenyl)acetyl-CoA isomerase
LLLEIPLNTVVNGMMDEVKLRIEGGIAAITLNRPSVMNALTPAMWARLLATFQEIEHDSSVKCVLLTGEGANFCSGHDVREFAKLASLSPGQIATELKRALDVTNPLFLTMERIPQPVVASVRGVVAGGGLSLVTACDLIVASDTATFLVAQIKLGAIPDASLAFNLRRAIGIKKAKQYCLLGEKMDAQTAADLKLINWLVPDADLEEKTLDVLNRLSGYSAIALDRTKAVLNRSFNNSLAAHAAEESLEVGRCVMDPAFISNVRAFTQRKSTS